MFNWLRNYRRRGILRQPFPKSWQQILEENVAHWQQLGTSERAELQSLIQVFVAEKYWEGCGGLEMTDEVRVTIAASACLLLLGLKHQYYRNVKSILVYPSAVLTKPNRGFDATSGMVTEKPAVPVLGQAMLGGPVLLVWDSVRHGAIHPKNGHNVVYHEFAHKLDMLDGSVDGTPPLATREQHAGWVKVCTEAFEDLKRRAARGKKSFLDPYGATNPGEFFAVATEFFFEKPTEMQRRHKPLYGVLKEFYGQDPVTRA